MLGTSTHLVMEICNRWSIAIDRDHVIGHREIYARKTCPGTWIDLDDFVARVRRLALDPASYNLVDRSGSVQARLDLNLRAGAPTTLAPIARTVPGGSTLEYAGSTSNGLTVNGNAQWYRSSDGELVRADARAAMERLMDVAHEVQQPGEGDGPGGIGGARIDERRTQRNDALDGVQRIGAGAGNVPRLSVFHVPVEVGVVPGGVVVDVPRLVAVAHEIRPGGRRS